MELRERGFLMWKIRDWLVSKAQATLKADLVSLERKGHRGDEKSDCPGCKIAAAICSALAAHRKTEEKP